MSLDQKDAIRLKLLQALYDLGGGTAGQYFDYEKLNKATSLSVDTLKTTAQYLIGEGFIDPTFADKLLALTHAGVVTWESILRDSQESRKQPEVPAPQSQGDTRKRVEEELLRKLDWLGKQYFDSAHRLEIVAEYLAHLADRIDHTEIAVDAPPQLLRRFDSVALQFQDEVAEYPDAVRENIKSLLSNDLISRTLGMLANLHRHDLYAIRRHYRWRMKPPLLKGLAAMVGIRTQLPIELEALSPKSMFETRMRLGRLAEVARYAASLGRNPGEPNFDRFSNYYDPGKINQNQVLSHLQKLSALVDSLPATDLKELLEFTIRELKTEVSSSRPRWGKVAATVLFVLSITANLKEVFPSTYDSTVASLQELVSYICQAGQTKPPTPLPPLLSKQVGIVPARHKEDAEDEKY